MAKVNYFDHETKPLFQMHFSEDFKRNKIRELEKNTTVNKFVLHDENVERKTIFAILIEKRFVI
jgi:hypothetical protein